MDEALTSLENDIKDERRDLDRNLEALEHQARALADWRTHYNNHPGMALAIAAAAGLTLAAIVPGPHQPRRTRQVVRTSESSFPSAALARLDPHGHARQQWADAWDQVVASLAGVGAAVLIGFVSRYVPGFDEEYEARRQSGYRGDRPRLSGT
jgi:hypothetical protein